MPGVEKWCLGCETWVELEIRRVGMDREGGDGHEQRPIPTYEACPNDDGTASGHTLIDAPPDRSK